MTERGPRYPDHAPVWGSGPEPKPTPLRRSAPRRQIYVETSRTPASGATTTGVQLAGLGQMGRPLVGTAENSISCHEQSQERNMQNDNVIWHPDPVQQSDFSGDCRNPCFA